MPRGLLLAVSLTLMLLPSAAAETWVLAAGGGSLGWEKGTAGLMFAPASGVSVRYWANATGDGSAAIVLTTCYTPGSHAVTYCERHWVQA